MRDNVVIVAMWSGPRNLSTALMRSFAQRPDCKVWDEPFYAAYLVKTGLDHPMREEVIRDGIGDPEAVIKACVNPPNAPKTLFYQKHMTHHMIGGIGRDWMGQVTNAFLIRSPQRVLASYAKKRETITAQDLGYSRQLELFKRVCDNLGEAPLVVDSTDIRKAPQVALEKMCTAIGIEFNPAMLSWEPGPSADDGIWGKHWYDNIWKSTKFAPPELELQPLPGHLHALYEEILPDYLAMERHKISVA